MAKKLSSFHLTRHRYDLKKCQSAVQSLALRKIGIKIWEITDRDRIIKVDSVRSQYIRQIRFVNISEVRLTMLVGPGRLDVDMEIKTARIVVVTAQHLAMNAKRMLPGHT